MANDSAANSADQAGTASSAAPATDESVAGPSPGADAVSAPQDDDNKVPVYEIHIQPMFRLIDQDHMMGFGINLGDLNSVWTNRTEILGRVSPGGGMPPTNVGGPWPDEWVALFERWIATGTDTEVGHHLVVAAPNSGNYRLTSGFGGRLQLSAIATPPSPGYRLWLDIDSITATQRTYTLVMEPPYPAQTGAGTALTATETFAKGTLTSIVINDANGQHTLPIP